MQGSITLTEEFQGWFLEVFHQDYFPASTEGVQTVPAEVWSALDLCMAQP